MSDGDRHIGTRIHRNPSDQLQLLGCHVVETGDEQRTLAPGPGRRLYGPLGIAGPVGEPGPVDQQVKGVSMGPIIEPSDRLNTIKSWYITAKSAVELQETPEGNSEIEGQ